VSGGRERREGASISVRDLTKRHGAVVAVDDLSLDVEAGEFVTILGPSGSGKTTTLMCIAGFVLPDAGDVLLDGRSILGLPSHKRNLGMVFQQAALFPHMTVADNIAFPLQMRDVPRAERDRRVQAALAMVRLPGLEWRRPHQLSGGQQQRVALARALVFEPPVLLLDEPLASLDLKLRHQLQAEIKRLHEELGVTVIAVTHDQGEALGMADRIVVMNEGRIQQVGTPEALYRCPANAFVAEFIGEANLLEGMLVAVDGQRAVAELADKVRVTGTLLSRQSEGGGSVTFVLRPEAILLGQESDGLPNVFDGVVEKVTYLGQITKCQVRVGSSTSLLVDWPNRTGMPRIRREDRVRIGWLADDMVAV